MPIEQETEISNLKLEIKNLKTQNTKLYKELRESLSLLEDINKLNFEEELVNIVEISENSSTLFIPLYDLHIGQSYNLPIGSYNLNIFKNMCQNLINKIYNIKETFDKVVIVFGGDIIDGRTIYNGQLLRTDSLSSQIIEGSKILTNYILSPIKARNKEITILNVVGNHGRLGDRGETLRVEDNLETIFYNSLWQQSKYLKLKWKLNIDNPYSYVCCNNINILFTHGEDFKSYSETPVNSACSYKDRMQSLLNNKIDIMVTGHHHFPASWSLGHTKLISCGCWVQSNEYSYQVGHGGPPTQTVFISSQEDHIKCLYQFNLSNSLTVNPIKI